RTGLQKSGECTARADGDLASPQHERARVLRGRSAAWVRQELDLRRKWKSRFWCAENAGDRLRYVALHAVGKAGAQLSGFRESAADVAASRPFQSAVVQQPGPDLSACSGGGGAPHAAACPGIRPYEQAPRRHRFTKSASDRTAAVFGVRSGQPLSDIAERRWRHPRAHSGWQARQLVRRELETFTGEATSPHLHFRSGRRCQPAAAYSAG